MSAQPQFRQSDARNFQPLLQTRDIIIGNVSNIGTNNTGTLELPPGLTYHALRLYIKDSAGTDVPNATIASEISEVKVKVDGNSRFTAKPSFLNVYQPYMGDYMGAANKAGILFLPLAEYFQDPRKRKATAWGTKDITNFSLEVKFGTVTAAPGLSGGTIQVVAEVEDLIQPMGLHRVVRTLARNHSSASVQEILDLPRNGIVGYRRMFFNDSGNISSVEVIRNTQGDSKIFLDDIPVTVLQHVQEQHRRNPQANWLALEFNRYDDVQGWLGMESAPSPVTAFKVKPNWSGGAPNAYDLVTETIENYLPGG